MSHVCGCRPLCQDCDAEAIRAVRDKRLASGQWIACTYCWDVRPGEDDDAVQADRQNLALWAHLRAMGEARPGEDGDADGPAAAGGALPAPRY